MKKIILIFLVIPAIALSQRGGNGNFSGFGDKKSQLILEEVLAEILLTQKLEMD